MITVVIPTLNEENFVAEAIRSVSFADEILVIDSFSSDATALVAQDAGAEVIQREFDDFSTQKNHAIERAENEWVLVIDADERVSETLASEIVRTVDNPGDKVAFYVFRNFYYKQTRVRYGGWQTDKAKRLFRKGAGRYNGKLVHETISTEGEVGFLKERLDHYSYRGKKQYAAKLEMYASLQAEEMFRQNKKPSFWFYTIKPGFRFFVHFVVRMGFLDGKPGFDLARAHAIGVWKRYTVFNERYKDATEIYDPKGTQS